MSAIQQNEAQAKATPLTEHEYTRVVENLFKHAHFTASASEIDALVESKTEAYGKAVEAADEATSILAEIASELPASDKAKIDAAVQHIDRLTTFNGDASMDWNHIWEIDASGT